MVPVSNQQVEDAIRADDATGLSAARAVAELFDGGRAEIRADDRARWLASDPGEAETQLAFDEGFETPAVPVGGVQGVIVSPRQGPVIAAGGESQNCLGVTWELSSLSVADRPMVGETDPRDRSVSV